MPAHKDIKKLNVRNPQAAAGFSLLEVLISLVILSVGLLGIAAMISTTLKANGSAYMRTQATGLAYNIIDRMRANMTATNNGQYDISMPGSASTASDPSACTTSTCDSTQLAAYDLDQWEYDAARLLPQGRGSITTNSTSGVSVVTIRVLWNDSRAHDSLQKTGAPTQTTMSLSVSSVL